MANARIIVASLTLSASALIGLAVSEGYTERAVVPTKNDRPTHGFGSTFNADGTPVKMGDKTTPERALVQLLTSTEKHADAIRSCIKVPLYQHEFDAYVSLSYQIGAGAFCRSTLIKKLNKGDYTGACNELDKWVYAGGKKLPGIVKRRQKEKETCLGIKK